MLTMRRLHILLAFIIMGLLVACGSVKNETVLEAAETFMEGMIEADFDKIESVNESDEWMFPTDYLLEVANEGGIVGLTTDDFSLEEIDSLEVVVSFTNESSIPLLLKFQERNDGFYFVGLEQARQVSANDPARVRPPEETEDEESTIDEEVDSSESSIVEDEAGLSLDSVTIGIVPFYDEEYLDELLAPLADNLTNELGVPVSFSYALIEEELFERLRTGENDVGFLNANQYIPVREEVDVILNTFDSAGNEVTESQFIVAESSNLHSLDDLLQATNLTWGQIELARTTSFLYPSSFFIENGINIETFNQVTFEEDGGALEALLAGEVDFITSFGHARDQYLSKEPNIMEKTRVIGNAAEIPNRAIVINNNVSGEWKQKVADAFVTISDDPEMEEIMLEAFFWSGFVEISDDKYDVVEKMTTNMLD
ncbi:phosphate/phosphite/phosphonate ABC transporter substrate-binding protein [Evansella cellulosilytica]|uniref:Uncharacterized protein n=1 Tax=Evansella cellulosilytica (strain ATCC 21833 / DSM 2522 / FERM P-1141 / JCM 9156 / N-4) TaxID=649639 RepID=E6TTY3_EVAC2|nr:phosphate/phosphite/phosphonate ABC transporter substrate-binding protein [Evansella cellulosilytica]ADU32014.1 hypothetical protein Bcell_3774 [Evansella cellulosilytica DSM 2522]